MTKNKTKKQVSSDSKNNENNNFEENKVKEVVSENNEFNSDEGKQILNYNYKIADYGNLAWHDQYFSF